ncbi:MAG TPA: gamma-glutamylcyclotransferase [Rubrivivax sp.]|nr:gamma-glutamylcyclotransferase [Rubrivivax sp.]
MMPMTVTGPRRSARLTPALVEFIARKVEDGGPAPGVVVHDDDDYEASLQATLSAGAWQGQDVWVFAYGSLLWNPAFEAAEQVAAVLPGWHRAFCIRLTRFRGTPQQPGLMMSLVPGGSCRGALVRIAGDQVLDSLRKLWRREMTVKPPNTPPRWMMARAGQGAVSAHGLSKALTPQRDQRTGYPISAIVFAADRSGPNFVSGLSGEQIAAVLCRAVGHWGSGAEYLMQTVDQLERLGIRDANLWRLQRLAAQQHIALKAAAA